MASTRATDNAKEENQAAENQPAKRAKVNFVQEGAQFEAARETRNLLQKRLQAVAFVVCATNAMFLVKCFIIDAPLKVVHISVTIALGVFAYFLQRKYEYTLKQLQHCQLGIYALIFGFFAAYQHAFMLQQAERGSGLINAIEAGQELTAAEQSKLYEEQQESFVQILGAYKSVASYWLIGGFLGMMVPGTWRRAACIFGPLTFVLPLTFLYTRACHPLIAQAVNLDQFMDTSMTIGMASFCAIFGTFIVNTLQTEAFEAREMGQYRLLKPIGEGGMGQVFLAQHRLLARPCAIKLIRPQQALDPTALVRFEREVQATAQLTHWNTIDIYDYGRHDDGTFYYVMEYLPGMDLDDLVKKHGSLPPARAVHLIRQTCQALREAHEHGLLHRDIKSNNIIVTKRGGVHDVTKLLDFGLVKSKVDDDGEPVNTSGLKPDMLDELTNETLQPMSLSASGGSSMDVELTRAGVITGTPKFMSPEQTRGVADERSDIYSLGSVLYLLLTGQVPFPENSVVKAVMALRSKSVPPPTELNRSIPADLEAVVMKSLAKKPEDRYASADEFDQALAACECAGGWSDRDAALWWSNVDSTVDADPEQETDETDVTMADTGVSEVAPATGVEATIVGDSGLLEETDATISESSGFVEPDELDATITDNDQYQVPD